eukprot:11089-Pelagomonas_calceolata.AAC.8
MTRFELWSMAVGACQGYEMRHGVWSIAVQALVAREETTKRGTWLLVLVKEHEAWSVEHDCAGGCWERRINKAWSMAVGACQGTWNVEHGCAGACRKRRKHKTWIVVVREGKNLDSVSRSAAVHLMLC